jgi:hypothetical protein
VTKVRNEDMTTSDLDNIYKMIDIIKDITTIEAMRNAEKDGYSRVGSYNSYDDSYGYSMNYSNARRGRDGDSDGRYSEDNSYRRGRDARGRYTSRDEGSSYRDGYSGHTKEQMVEKLEQMMRDARDEQERENYRRAIEQLER